MKTKQHIRIVLGGCLIFFWLMIGSEQVDAYSYKKGAGQKIAWKDKIINWQAGAKSFPAGSPWRNALTVTNIKWNQAPANFTFGIGKWGDTNFRRGNGQNEIWFSSSQNVLDGSPALCYRWKYYNMADFRYYWYEADVIFDVDEGYSPYEYQYDFTAYGGQYRPFVTTALHEMGHALGLGHENRFYNIMGSDFTHIHTHAGTTQGYTGADGTQGALFLYGKQYGSATEDLAVTHWKYAGVDGEYSTHTQTLIYHTNGDVVYWLPQDGFPRHHVRMGDSYDVEFTYENNGFGSYTNVKVAWYLSTNKIITIFDQQIGAAQIGQFPGGAVWTVPISLTIPTGLKVGMTYYLGAIIDFQNNIGEFKEDNNAACLQVKIVS